MIIILIVTCLSFTTEQCSGKVVGLCYPNRGCSGGGYGANDDADGDVLSEPGVYCASFKRTDSDLDLAACGNPCNTPYDPNMCDISSGQCVTAVGGPYQCIRNAQ